MVGWSDDTIIVKGVDDLLITRARCCNPLRGEQIIGYISLGKGIVVHTKRCKNVTSLLANKERIVEVEWASSNNDKESFAVKLLAITENRTGMIAGITGAIADIKTGIRNASAIVSNDDRGHIEITVEVFDVKHLDKVISSVKSVAGVLDVERLNDA
jgi:GTP pyrophosphokinase